MIGVLGVPDVMRASTASQSVQRVVGARRDKLAADYQRAQQSWRDMQQNLVNQRGSLSQEQLQARERALQDRVAAETKQFRARNRVIQEAGQISLAQIERVLVAVIRQVSESRGMNLVLHRQQVALNIADFDITDQVTAQLNTLLPSVTIPPDGEEPTPAQYRGCAGGGRYGHGAAGSDCRGQIEARTWSRSSSAIRGSLRAGRRIGCRRSGRRRGSARRRATRWERPVSRAWRRCTPPAPTRSVFWITGAIWTCWRRPMPAR